MKSVLVLIAAALAIAAQQAWADEAVKTHAGEAPTAEAAPTSATAAQDDRQANGDWARRVLDHAANSDQAKADEDKDQAAKNCQRNPDRKPHGEVWAGAGTGGYHTAGAVVTQPIGDCGRATVAVSQTDYGHARGHRR